MNQDQSELDKLIIDLKVLKQIPEYGKLSTQNDALTLDKGYMFQWLSRWWSNESRELTIKYIMNTVAISSKFTTKFLQDSQVNYKGTRLTDYEKLMLKRKTNTMKELKDSFVGGKSGLENLIKTYETDETTVSHLELYIQKLNELINELNLKLNTIKESHIVEI